MALRGIYPPSKKEKNRHESPDNTIGKAKMEAVLGDIDLLTLILLRVPAKPLVRFKSVSKVWFSLISDPNFGITHTHQNITDSLVSGFYYIKYGEVISLRGCSSLPTMTCLNLLAEYDVVKPEIVHSCNGLFLFRQKHSLRPIVFNPTTQKYRLLPPLPNYPYSLCDCLLAFEPLRSHHYKVVMMSKEEPHSNHYRALIFASQTGSWEDKLVSATPGNCCTWRIYSNGAIHWLIDNNIHIRFDIYSNEIIENPLPPETRIGQGEKYQFSRESNGRLFLIQYPELGAPEFRILEMDTDTHCWTIKHHINLRSLVLQFPEIHTKLRPERAETFDYSVVYVKSGADMKCSSLVLAIPGKVVLYKVTNDKNTIITGVLCEFPYSFVPWHERSRYVHPFIQCLAPV